MIVAALYVRGDLPRSGGAGPLGQDAPVTLVCVPELKSVCEPLAEDGVTVVIQEAGETADGLAGPGALPGDAWLTLAPWDVIVGEARQRGGLGPLAADPSTVLARSPMVLVTWAERGAVLDRQCKPELTWKCVARVAGKAWDDVGGKTQWGTIKPGYADPSVSATGLLVLGQAAGDFLGSTSFSARDFEDDTFLRLLGDLEAAVPTHGTSSNTPLQQQLQFGPGRFDVVGTTEAEAGPLLESSPRAADLQLRYPKKVAVADVVLAPLRDGDGADRLRELLEQSGPAALARSGWRVKGQPAAGGVPAQPALPAETNLPAAGVLDALRARWGEIR